MIYSDTGGPGKAPPDSAGAVYPAGTGDHRVFMRGTAIGSPGVRALPRQLALARALRGFGRRVHSRWEFVVDEDATTARIADEDLWVPVLRPAPERWLSLILVEDSAPSMAVWRQTVTELRALTEWTGLFRDVRIRQIDGSAPDTVRDPLTGMPTDRTVIMVVTDTVGTAWREGRIEPLLRQWGRRSPTAVATVLPQRMWPGSGISVAAGEVRVPYPGAANSHWQARTGAEVPIPVLEISERWFELFGGLTAAAAGWRRSALLGPPSPGRRITAANPATAADRIARFRSVASPTAFRLACYLSAAPLTLPVMRLV